MTQLIRRLTPAISKMLSAFLAFKIANDIYVKSSDLL